MRKLFCLAAVLGGMLVPVAPPVLAQPVVVFRPHPAHRGRFFHRGHWYNHRAMRRGHWAYW